MYFLQTCNDPVFIGNRPLRPLRSREEERKFIYGEVVEEDLEEGGTRFVFFLYLSIFRQSQHFSTGVSIIFKIRVVCKASFEGFEFFIGWPYAVLHKMQVVFYKKCAFYVFLIFMKDKQCYCQM